MTALFRARVVLLISALVFFPTESPAQQLSLSGTVRDTTGVVPGATVVLSSGGNQVSTATTDEAGVYRFSGLAAGSYELSFAMRGFETAVRNVTLGPDTPPVDVVLSVGRVSTTLTVDGVGRQGHGHPTARAERRRPGPGELDSAGTDAAAGHQHRRGGAEERVRRPGGPLVRRVRAVHRFAASSIPIATASTSCCWTACAWAATATARRPTTSRASRS